MAMTEFDPARALGEAIGQMDRQQLCELVIALCRKIRAEVGDENYRGGVYPGNISRDEAGEPAIGEGRLEGWEGQELDFVAPELYWHGQAGPASDVYSLGLLLYYGLSHGKLPFEGESANAQLSRMSGKAFTVPKSAGARLGEIVGKAAAFREEDRYRNAEELAVMLDSCLENRYVDGDDDARSIFRKDAGDLSDIERMMMSIIRGEAEEEPPAEDFEPVEERSAEEAMEEILADNAPPKLEQEKESPEDLVEEFFHTRLADEDEAAARIRPAIEPEPDDVRLYEPGQERRERPPIPILTEEKNPELAPIVPKHQPKRTVQYSSDPERSRQIGEEVERRRKRPLLVILFLCVLLLAVAAVAKYFLQHYEWKDNSVGTMTVNTPTPGENAPQLGEDGTGSIVTPAPDPLIGQQGVRYEVYVDDAGWIDAKAKAEAIGGHLVVITSPTELEKVAAAIAEAGLARAWIGCHRVDGQYVWESEEYVSYYPWDENEPSKVDGYDGAAEDFLMLWNHNGWCYNDSRANPAADFPAYYSGSIGYVVEFGYGE